MLGKRQIVTLLFCASMAARAWGAPTSNEATEFYSRGVRAFFAGDSREAELYLSLAAEMRPDDPRIFYFRALALERLGRTNEARGDIVMAATLEAAHPQRYAVGKALERVQGSRRLRFEQVREEAHREVAVHAPEIRLAQHESAPFNDEAFLRQPVTVALEDFLPIVGPELPAEPPYPVEPAPRLPNPSASPLASGDELEAPVAEAASVDDPFVDDPIMAPGEEDAGGAEATRQNSEDIIDFGSDEISEEIGADESLNADDVPATAEEDAFGIDEDDPFAEL